MGNNYGDEHEDLFWEGWLRRRRENSDVTTGLKQAVWIVAALGLGSGGGAVAGNYQYSNDLGRHETEIKDTKDRVRAVEVKVELNGYKIDDLSDQVKDAQERNESHLAEIERLLRETQ